MSTSLEPPPTTTVGDTYRPDQLVVDTGDLDTVAGMLARLGITWSLKSPPKKSLKKKRGYDVDRLADGDVDDHLGLARLSDIQDHDQKQIDVGDLLAFIRQRSAAERDGWVPLMGKNRFVDGVIGEGYKPHFATYPEPVKSQELSRYWATYPPAAPGTGKNVVVGMVDTLLTPPALGKASAPHPFRTGHGMFVADLIKQQAPDVTLKPAEILIGPDARADSWTTGRAIVALARIPALSVLNLSIGCHTMAGGPPLVISRAIERVDPRILIVAAAGNHGDFTLLEGGRDQHSAIWPAALARPIAVGAVDANGEPPKPNWSPDLPWVNVVARGVDVVARYFGGAGKGQGVEVDFGDPTKTTTFHGYAKWSGTSFAAAMVSGAVAARIVPGTTAKEAFDQLLEEHSVVSRYQGSLDG